MNSYLFNNTHLAQIDTSYFFYKLPLFRQKKLQSYKYKSHFYSSLAGDILLLYALQKLYGISKLPLVSFGPFGKPFFVDSNLNIHFNISHSGEYTICTISDTPVGVDIQKIELYSEQEIISIANHFFTPDEVKLILASPNRIDLFFCLWSLKESYIKYLGTGLSTALDSFSFTIKNNPFSLDFFTKEHRQNHPNFHLSSLSHSYKLAVCSDKTTSSINIIELSDIMPLIS